MTRLALAWVLVAVLGSRAMAAENLIGNGDFEAGLEGWSDPWARDREIRVSLDRETRHGGDQALRIEHAGQRDWSVAHRAERKVQPGELYELSGWVRGQGEGDVALSVTLYGPERKVISWSWGMRKTPAAKDWVQLHSRFTIPAGVISMVPRLTGEKRATVWVDDLQLAARGAIDIRPIKTASDTLDVTLYPADGTLQLQDRRTRQTWKQQPQEGAMVIAAKPVDGGFDLRLIVPESDMELNAVVRLEKDRPELTVELSAQGEQAAPVAFPPPFVTAKGTFLVMPLNEGIAYPVDDETLRPMRYYLYGGHGLCMGWWGVSDGRQGLMTLVETPDDAAVKIPRVAGLLCAAPQWEPQRGRFGPPRRLRYIVFDQGGYVAMCKRYRQHAREVGLLKTLSEKRKENANVDRLIGAVNVWCYANDPVEMCRQMQAAGIERILWSNRAKPDEIRQLNAMGALTSRYDIYQDAMDPAIFPKLNGIHGDWTSSAWPQDLMIGADGQWIRGWEVETKDGSLYPCGVLCDRQALPYVEARVPKELATHPYTCRFIDTTTASPWRECYHPDHPMTRSESKHWKMELLRLMSEKYKLVTGSETGHEAAVPFVHYFEGMLSLGPYRIHDAGRNTSRIIEEVPEQVARFQTGHFYRLPLWELVYHDCVVAQWYWGDYNNKLPKLWDRRDLWNALYGTPAMFMLDKKNWQRNRERFVKSYRQTSPVARATGYVEMTSHRWLTADHAVQQTQFANGVSVTVNFGETPFALPDGTSLPPLGSRIVGLGN
jgi:glycosyl hydrolase family 129/carbohydrate binding protein with CBM4/9 domain